VIAFWRNADFATGIARRDAKYFIQSVADMTAELRKHHIDLILAHQYLYQLDAAVREAVLGNVGTMIAFRVGVIRMQPTWHRSLLQ